MNSNYDELREDLDQNLDNLTRQCWKRIFSLYTVPLDIIRQYRDFIDWEVVYEYGIFDKLDDPIEALREFREEMSWEQGMYKKWIDELKIKYNVI